MAEVKGWHRGGGAPSQVPIGIQTMLFATAALVALGALAVFLSAWTINGLKDQLVDEAREDAHLAASLASERIRTILQSHPGEPLEAVVANPEIRRQLDKMMRDGSIALVSVDDTGGRAIFQHISQETVSECFPPDIIEKGIHAGNPTDYYLQAAKNLPASLVPVEIALQSNGEFIGSVHVALSTNLSMARIDLLGQRITGTLMMLVLIAVSITLLTIVLAYYAFRRQMELQHRAAEAEHLASLGTLASGLAHEIRNPLHAMNLHLGVAREDIESGHADAAETGECIKRVMNQIGHLNHIVTEFLSATVCGKLEMQDLRLDHLIREAAGFYGAEFAADGIELTVDLPAELPIRGDYNALQQVFHNVLINARQALSDSKDRRVVVSAEADRRVWRVFVDDTGPGIPEEDASVIFKTFVSKKAGGTGFGLSIARRIMEGHCGRISATRSPLGGARFVIEFPRPGDPSASASATG